MREMFPQIGQAILRRQQHQPNYLSYKYRGMESFLQYLVECFAALSLHLLKVFKCYHLLCAFL